MSEMATIQTSLTMSCGVKAFFERRTARTPRSCFDSALVEELIIDDEGSHVICRAELGPTQTSLRLHVRP